MKCPSCGAAVEAGASPCPACGFPVAGISGAGVTDDGATQFAAPAGATTGIANDMTRVATSQTSGGPTGRASAGSGLLEAGQAFGSRYHIIRELGVGGMGAVYQAWDAELGVAVAIKVIRPDVIADAAASAIERRFKRGCSSPAR